MACSFSPPPDSILQTYAQRVGADSTGQPWVLAETLKALHTRRLCCYGDFDPRPNGHPAGCGGQAQDGGGANFANIGSQSIRAGAGISEGLLGIGSVGSSSLAPTLGFIAGPLAIAA